jgi:hypothetical protein
MGQASPKLSQGRALIDIPMAQHVGAEDRLESSFREGKLVDRAITDRTAALLGGARAGSSVDLQPDGVSAGEFGSDLGQETAGATASIEDRLRGEGVLAKAAV